MAEMKTLTQKCEAMKQEMDEVAADARSIISDLSGRTKFELAYPHGWWSLKEATDSERFMKSLPAETRVELRRLCTRWISLYVKLTFLVDTRPVWNT